MPLNSNLFKIDIPLIRFNCTFNKEHPSKFIIGDQTWPYYLFENAFLSRLLITLRPINDFWNAHV